MRLTRSTDFALRVLLYSTMHRDRWVSTDEISRAFGMSAHHLGKVISQLGRHGWLTLKRGRGGGLKLAVDPASIRLGDVVREIEPDFFVVECFDHARNTCPIVPACRLVAPLEAARQAFMAVLDGQTLADVAPRDADEAATLVRLLEPRTSR